MYRTTPLSHNMPSPYELIYGRKPRILIPSSNHALQLTHADNDQHKDMNQLIQEKQAKYYNKKASQTDRRPLHIGEPVYVYNTLTKMWDKGEINMIPNPTSEPRTYILEKGGRLYQRIREHLRPRSTPQHIPVQKFQPIMPTAAFEPIQLPDRHAKPPTLLTQDPGKQETTNQNKASSAPSNPSPNKQNRSQPEPYITRYGCTVKLPVKLQ